MDPAEVAQEIDDFRDADWSDFTVKQLEELAMTYLDIRVKRKIRSIMHDGYTEEAATKAFVKAAHSGEFYQLLVESKNSNMQYAIHCLRNDKEKDILGEHYLEDLQKVKRRALNEFVDKICTLRPSFSTGNALWLFLMCDSAVCMDTLHPDSETATNNNSSLPTSNKPETEMKITELDAPDASDLVITKLVRTVQKLESQDEEWKQWSDQKVMQAVRRLGENKGELELLRKVKEAAEKHHKNKLCQMENALYNARGQVEHENSIFKKMEIEKSALRKQMETAKSQSVESAAKYQEELDRSLRREMDGLGLENQCNSLKEELVDEKLKTAQTQHELTQRMPWVGPWLDWSKKGG